MYDAASALPMKEIGGGIEDVELADTDTHRVGIAVDVTVFGGGIEPVPEAAVVAHVGGRKGNGPTRNKTQDHAGGEFLHFAMVLPRTNDNRLARLRICRKIVTSRIWVK